MTDDELKSLFDALRQENATGQAETRHDFHQTANQLSEETRRHFEVFSERLEKRFDLLAESVRAIDEKVDRRVGAVELAIGNSAAETQAMIKFSHAELDRRLRAVEEKERSVDETLADIQARLERLESSTH
jgi:hypothetical protein